MMKTKMIKTEILERRFKKLHTMTEFARDSCKAIVLHADRLANLMPTEEQKSAHKNMIISVNEWCDNLDILDSTMKATETMYYKHLSADGMNCEVIESIPVCPKGYMPNTFQMTEAFYRVGYYAIEGDPFKISEREYTTADIMKDIQELNTNVVLCLKALINASYNGIWESTGLLINRLYDFEPNVYIYKLLKSYNVDMVE